MKTFTIDTDNNISAFATSEEAAASNPSQSFAGQQELAALAATWPAERLGAIWNSLPGVKPVKGFKSGNAAASRIWERVQGLGDAVQPEEQPAKPKADRKAKGGAKVAKGAPAKGKATKKATPVKNAPKAKKAAKAQQVAGPREGSKTAQVVAMLQRKNGATLEEIMERMGWLRHTARGFMAGAIKKAGYSVESFKSDKGERTYRINQWHRLPPSWPARLRPRRAFLLLGQFPPESRKPSPLGIPSHLPPSVRTWAKRGARAAKSRRHQAVKGWLHLRSPPPPLPPDRSVPLAPSPDAAVRTTNRPVRDKAPEGRDCRREFRLR